MKNRLDLLKNVVGTNQISLPVSCDGEISQSTQPVSFENATHIHTTMTTVYSNGEMKEKEKLETKEEYLKNTVIL